MAEHFGDNDKFCKLFIGGLNFDTTKENLKAHFEQYGEVVKCVIVKNPSTNRSKGFGFITFKNPDSLDQAQNKRPHSIDGKQVDTKRAIPRDEVQENKVSVNKIFVGGLDENTSEEQVKETFSSYGNVEKVEMIKDKNTGKQKRFCFVTFGDHDSADKCIIQKHFQLCGRNVEVKKAVPKNELGQSDSGGDMWGGGGNYGGGQSLVYGGTPGVGNYGGGQSLVYGGIPGVGNYGGGQSLVYGGTPGGGGQSLVYGGTPGGGGQSLVYGGTPGGGGQSLVYGGTPGGGGQSLVYGGTPGGGGQSLIYGGTPGDGTPGGGQSLVYGGTPGSGYEAYGNLGSGYGNVTGGGPTRGRVVMLNGNIPYLYVRDENFSYFQQIYYGQNNVG